MIIDRSTTHDLMPNANCDEASRTAFVVEMKRKLSQLQATNEKVFESRAAPAYRAKAGKDPKSVEEIEEAMRPDPFYQMWSALSRSAQELMWNAVEETTQRELPRISEAAQRFRNAPEGGSVEVDPSFVAPQDAFAADIHGQPGGYMRDAGEGDMRAGALYECGGNAFSAGTGIGSRDSKSAAVIRYIKETYPEFKPRRILDLGCSAGGASVGYAAEFRDAEVYAVDVAPAMLRYAHCRAEALGVKVHFLQMDAQHLTFADDYFDLVVSHNLLHEVSNSALGRIFTEARRVVREGGLVIHQDVPVKAATLSNFEKFISGWQTRNNDEPFWDDFTSADMVEEMKQAGFQEGEVREVAIKMLDGPRSWYAVVGCNGAPE
jgi:ubiquinone/menaquinone biosynthesis C-methylase UbiE